MNREEAHATTLELADVTREHREFWLREACSELVGSLIAVATLEIPKGVDVRETVSGRVQNLIRECRDHVALCQGCT